MDSTLKINELTIQNLQNQRTLILDEINNTKGGGASDYVNIGSENTGFYNSGGYTLNLPGQVSFRDQGITGIDPYLGGYRVTGFTPLSI